MSKPTLCEILGVEPDQKFEIEGFKNTARDGIYFVDSDGDFLIKGAVDHGGEYVSTYVVCYAIRHPEEIIDVKTHKPIMTQNDPINDPINHPSHYCSGGFECIDIMLATQGKDDVQGYCVCNAIKYLWRHKGKGGLEDVKKARWYLDEYIKLEDEEEDEDE